MARNFTAPKFTGTLLTIKMEEFNFDNVIMIHEDGRAHSLRPVDPKKKLGNDNRAPK